MRWTLNLQVVYFSALLQSFFPPLNNGDIRASLHVSGILFCVREALNNSVIASVISFEVSFSILAGIPPAPFALNTYKSLRSFFTPSVVNIISSISDARGDLITGIF